MDKIEKNSLQKVFTAKSNAEADIVRGFLSEHGIESICRGYDHRSLLQMMGPYISLDILVPADQVPAARELIQEHAAALQGQGQDSQNKDPAQDSEARPIPTIFLLFTPLFLPGFCNSKVGNKGLGKYLGIAAAVWIIIAAFGMSFDLSTKALEGLMISYLWLGILDLVTGLSYRSSPTPQRKRTMQWVAIGGILCLPPLLWFALQPRQHPIRINRVTFVEENGSWTSNSEYRPGDKIFLNLDFEPINTPNTNSRIVPADLKVRVKNANDGRVLIERSEKYQLSTDSLQPMRLEIALSKEIQLGKYLLYATLVDLNSNHESHLELPFLIVGKP